LKESKTILARSCEEKALTGSAFLRMPGVNPQGQAHIVSTAIVSPGSGKGAGRLRQRHGCEDGFPLIRSLRALAQRSTSVLFSFVLSLSIVAGPFAIANQNHSGAILAMGTGVHGALPVMDEVFAEPKRRGIELIAAA
jgi:hypothetical protein